MPFGYNGKILRVNLSSGHISVEQQDEKFYRKYIGGEGFVAYYLLKDVKPRIDPLSPENKLIFAAGPLTGAPIPGCGRNSIGAKSPLTGGFGESEVGGTWGAELKRAGFDAIIVEGRSSDPVYLWVHDGEVEIMDAKHLWGKETGETQIKIRGELGDNLVRVASIGSGGERLVRFACIIVDLHDAAGRTGMGAVMGSKKLKALAVRGRKKLAIYNPEKLKEFARWLNENMDRLVYNFHNYGTGVAMDSYAASGNLPVRNFRDGYFANPEKLDARTIKMTISVGMDGCYACSVRCKKIVKIGEPWNVDPMYGGPEYEALAALGSNCGIDSLEPVTKANEICNRCLLDAISTGATIAFAMECYENGILTDKDTDGLILRFGNAEAMVKMVEKIAYREGLGNLLAEGVKRASAIIGKGSEKFAMHVKGLEIPMHEPRLKRSLGLGYVVSPTGADHMRNLHDTGLVSAGSMLDALSSLGILEPIPLENLGPRKVRAFIYYVDWRVLDNCLLFCDFLPWDFNQKTEIIKAITGWNTSTWDLMKTSERIITMARIFNLREGLAKRDDWLPERFFNPTRDGPLSNTSLKSEAFRSAIELYYEMMSWDKNGVPTRARLRDLDMDEFVGVLPDNASQ